MSGRDRLHRLLFSDTLFLWSDPMPKNDIRRRARCHSFLTSVAELIRGGLLHDLPLRAGVAFGPVLVQARKQIVGQPIVDAYLTEGLQNWIGGALHESFPRYAPMNELEYGVPVKEHSAPLRRAIDWIFPDSKWPDVRARIERVLERGKEEADSEAVRLKYLNTLDYLRFASDYWDSCRWPKRNIAVSPASDSKPTE